MHSSKFLVVARVVFEESFFEKYVCDLNFLSSSRLKTFKICFKATLDLKYKKSCVPFEIFCIVSKD